MKVYVSKIRLKTLTFYTVSQKKVSHLMCDNNFGNCGPIFKFFSQIDSQENSLCIHCKYSHLICNMLLHYLVKFEIQNVTECSRWTWQYWYV